MASLIEPDRPHKRRRLSYDAPTLGFSRSGLAPDSESESSGTTCAICLEDILHDTRAVLRPCGHAAFDFGCITRWLSLSTLDVGDGGNAATDAAASARRPRYSEAEAEARVGEPACPLCKSVVAYVCHSIDGARYRKWYPPTAADRAAECAGEKRGGARARRTALERRRERERRLAMGRTGRVGASLGRLAGATSRQAPGGAVGSIHSDGSLSCGNESDRLTRRRQIYELDLRARHVGANALSGFRDITLSDYRLDEGLRSRASLFLRRELRCISLTPCSHSTHASGAPAIAGNDVRSREFARQFIADGVLTRLDLQSEGARKLVGDLIGHRHAATLLHELRTFLRSPYDTLEEFDASPLIQY